jgi:predicted RNase H-like HicB family nuclease
LAKRNAPVDRPFAPALLARARKIVAGYQVLLWFEDGDWYGRGLELPTVLNDGKSPGKCVQNVQDAMVTTVAWMLEAGKQPPAPASQNLRTEQVNVRLTPEEKLAVESAAKQRGFDGISDFVRSAAMKAVG